MAWQQAFPCEFVGLERKEEKGEGRKGVFANTVSFEIIPFSRNFNLQNGEKLNAEPSTDHCRICRRYNYFGGARSKGFATLRNVSKLQFFDKIGQAKSVGFRLYSAI